MGKLCNFSICGGQGVQGVQLVLQGGQGVGGRACNLPSVMSKGRAPTSTTSVASAVLLCCGSANGSASNAGMGGRGLSH